MEAVIGETASAKDLEANFTWFSVWFAIHHGFVTTPLVIATIALSGTTGYNGNALLNVCSVVSSFLLAAPTVARLGLRRSLVFAMSLYCCFTGLFCVSLFLKETSNTDAFDWLYCIGAVCGGAAAGIGWTAQGTYFTRTVRLLASQSDDGARSSTALTAKLSSLFAVWFLGAEVVSKLFWALLTQEDVPYWLIALIFTCVGVISSFFMSKSHDLEEEADALPAQQQHWLAKFKATFALWSDPCIHLLSGTNLTFGFAAAFMNGYVGATYTKPVLGQAAVPMLAALTPAVSCVFSFIYGRLAANYGKGLVITFGALCFLAIPVAAYCAPLHTWGWSLTWLYVLLGAGRGVYESTNKGVFADFFPRDPLGAFANCMLQSTGALALSFFLSKDLGDSMQVIILVFAVATPVGYIVASRLRPKDAEEEPLTRP